MISRLSPCAFALALAVLLPGAGASVLTFNTAAPTTPFNANQSVATPKLNDPTLPLYGDHIAAATAGSLTTPNAYSYGSAHGFTPNVGVAYGPGTAATATSSGNPYPVWYPTTFGDLTNVLYQVDLASGTGNPAVYVPNLTLNITLTADPGYSVSLYGFDLAGYQNYPSVGFIDNLDQLSIIVNGTPNVVGNNIGIATSPSGHNSFDFSAAPYTGSTIQILMDGRDLTPYGGSAPQAYLNFTDIAIDNIAFSQEQLPEPTSLALLGIGTLMFVARRGRIVRHFNSKRIAMTTRSLLLASVVALFLGAPLGHAAVITLTGGDAVDASDSVGYAPDFANVVYAYRISATNTAFAGADQSAYTYSSVTFQPFLLNGGAGNTAAATTTVGSATITNGFFYQAGAGLNAGSGGGPVNGNDTALFNVAKYQSFSTSGHYNDNHGTQTLLLSGLVAGVRYQVDIFSANIAGGTGAQYLYTMTGAGAPTADSAIPPGRASGGIVYDVRQSVVADALGNITVTATDNGFLAADNAVINAFSVVALPEPATAMLVFVGASLLALSRQRRGS